MGGTLKMKREDPERKKLGYLPYIAKQCPVLLLAKIKNL
jgi:hypothetical protein